MTRNTPLVWFPLIVTPAAGPVIVSVPVVLVNESWVPFRVIVWGLAKTVGSKVIVLAPVNEFARAIAWRRSVSPVTGVSVGLFTTSVPGRLVRPKLAGVVMPLAVAETE